MAQQTSVVRLTNRSQKWYPTHRTIEYGNIKKIKILLPHTKDINEKNEEGELMITLACQQKNSYEILEILLNEKDIDPTLTNDKKSNALHILAFLGKLKEILRLLEKFPKFPIDAEDDKGSTPLIMAAKLNHVEIIEYLHSKGADVNHRNKKLSSALMYTSNNGWEESTKKLIQLGAKVNIRDSRGVTPLMTAAGWGFVEIAKILLDNGAEVNAKNKHDHSILIEAVRRSNMPVVKLLIENGAALNEPVLKNSIRTPLSYACLNNNVPILKLLIDGGADINFPGNYSLALFTCIWRRSVDCLKELLQANVRISGEDAKGYTAVSIARQNGFQEIVELLQTQMSQLKI